jgi:hypothetical protein
MVHRVLEARGEAVSRQHKAEGGGGQHFSIGASDPLWVTLPQMDLVLVPPIVVPCRQQEFAQAREKDKRAVGTDGGGQERAHTPCPVCSTKQVAQQSPPLSAPWWEEAGKERKERKDTPWGVD